MHIDKDPAYIRKSENPGVRTSKKESSLLVENAPKLTCLHIWLAKSVTPLYDFLQEKADFQNQKPSSDIESENASKLVLSKNKSRRRRPCARNLANMFPEKAPYTYTYTYIYICVCIYMSIYADIYVYIYMHI